MNRDSVSSVGTYASRATASTNQNQPDQTTQEFVRVVRPYSAPAVGQGLDSKRKREPNQASVDSEVIYVDDSSEEEQPVCAPYEPIWSSH